MTCFDPEKCALDSDPEDVEKDRKDRFGEEGGDVNDNVSWRDLR
jgi:hypothetical protein